jgi:hypothetical protein
VHGPVYFDNKTCGLVGGWTPQYDALQFEQQGLWSNELYNSPSFTFTFWFYVVHDPSEYVDPCTGSGAPSEGHGIYVTFDDTTDAAVMSISYKSKHLYVVFFGQPIVESASTNTLLPIGIWHHVAIRWNQDTKWIETLVNGTSYSKMKVGGPAPFPVSVSKLNLFASYTLAIPSFDGRVDELRKFSTYLNDTEVLSIMQSNPSFQVCPKGTYSSTGLGDSDECEVCPIGKFMNFNVFQIFDLLSFYIFFR